MLNGDCRKRIGIVPGSFDPITNGYLDIILRALKNFDKLHIVVLNNSSKHSLFTVEERKNLISACLLDIPNIQVESYHGLLVELQKEQMTVQLFEG